jgi:penicillin-binding protein 2
MSAARAVHIKDHWSEQRLFETRALIAAAVIFVLTFSLIGRLYVLQVVRHDYYTQLSHGNRVRIEPIPASRGLLLDRRGRVLVGNQPIFQIELVPEQVPNLDQTLQGLATLGLVDRNEVGELKRQIRSRRSFDSVPVRAHLSEEEIARFAVNRFNFPGVDIKSRETRWYPFADLAVHALGYVAAISEQDLKRIDPAAYSGTSTIGKLGVESAYEPELHGLNGSREVLVNAQGRSVEKQGPFAQNLRTQAPNAGKDLILSIDLDVQRVAEQELGSRRGAVVALDPRTGDVIALVSRPGFDPNLFARGITRNEYISLQQDIDRPLFDRALRGTYPPGSTIKPALALAGLSYGVIAPEQRRFCSGVFSLPGSSHLYREGRGGKHGQVNLDDAIARSCDVYFYALANYLGVDRISSFLKPFGFGDPTGIDIAGEKAGLLPSREWKARTFKSRANQIWFPGETVNLGIGQGYMLVTPIQLAQVTSVIATRGHGFKPRLVTAFKGPMTGAVTKLPAQPLKPLTSISEDEWSIVIHGMIGATTRGTAAAIGRGATYAIAGKTGTAQVFTVAQNAKYEASKVDERLRDHSWFVAFAPAESPRIAVAVLVENGGFGALAAAPIVRKVLDAYLLPQATTQSPAVQQVSTERSNSAASPATSDVE